MRAIWDVFNRLGRDGGPDFHYLTQQEISAYMSNNGIRLTPWELDCIHDLDAVAASVFAQNKKAQ